MLSLPKFTDEVPSCGVAGQKTDCRLRIFSASSKRSFAASRLFSRSSTRYTYCFTISTDYIDTICYHVSRASILASTDTEFFSRSSFHSRTGPSESFVNPKYWSVTCIYIVYSAISARSRTAMRCYFVEYPFRTLSSQTTAQQGFDIPSLFYKTLIMCCPYPIGPLFSSLTVK